MPRLLGLVVSCVLVLGAAGCSGGGEPSGSRAASSGSTPASGSGGEPAARTGRAAPYGVVQRLLRTRAQAVRSGDRAGFLATTARGAGRARQLAWFGPLASLPLAKVSYDVRLVDPHGTADRTRVEADMLVRIAGFDPAALPVSHVLSLRKAADGWRVAEDRAARSQISFAPWLLPGVHFSVTEHALVVYDAKSVAQSERVDRLVDLAVEHADQYVPYDWSDKVVVLAPSNTAPLRYEGFDPAEIRNLGGVAYPIRGPDEHVTGARIVIAPVMMKADDTALLTVLRHEVAHVAIGIHDEGAPVWVGEGLAEYVAHLGDSRLSIATSAVEAAQRGIHRMPPDGLFHSGDWGISYGTAWFAMRWLAEQHGEDAPFALNDALVKKEPLDFHQESRLLRDRYQVTTDQLAARAGALIHETFGEPG